MPNEPDPDGEKAMIQALRQRQIFALCVYLQVIGNLGVRAIHEGHGHEWPFALLRRVIDLTEKDFMQMHIDDPDVQPCLKQARERAATFNNLPSTPNPDA